MKLPKPGKVKLPKPGNRKLPSFHLKNGFVKKNLITLIAVAVLLVGSGTAYGTLATREADRGYDPIDGVNEDRYQVLVSGEGYKLSKQQEKNYKLQKKQNEINAERTAMNAQNPTNIRTSSGTRYYRSSHYRYRYRGSTYKISRGPRLSTNIQSQIRSKMSWKAGDELQFRLVAYAYPYGTKNAIAKDYIKVTADGGTLKYDGEKYGNYWYTLTLAEGSNKITITVKDKTSKKKYKSGPYTVTAGKKAESGNDPSDPDQPTTEPKPTENEITVDFGFGTLTSEKIRIDDNTTAYDVLSKTEGIAFDGKHNVVSVEGDMSGFSLDGYSQSDLEEICKREEADTLDEERDNIESEIRENAEEGTTDDEIAALVDAAFEEYFKDFFKDWKQSIEEEMRAKESISNGEPFPEFKWTYNKSAKGKDIASKINLRLVLESVE